MLVAGLDDSLDSHLLARHPFLSCREFLGEPEIEKSVASTRMIDMETIQYLCIVIMQ